MARKCPQLMRHIFNRYLNTYFENKIEKIKCLISNKFDQIWRKTGTKFQKSKNNLHFLCFITNDRNFFAKDKKENSK